MGIFETILKFKYNVSEVFASVQGEGTRAGKPCFSYACKDVSCDANGAIRLMHWI